MALQAVRKHCGKRRNCSLRAISPFPTVFSKDLYCRHVKPGLVWVRVKVFHYQTKKKSILHERQMEFYKPVLTPNTYLLFHK